MRLKQMQEKVKTHYKDSFKKVETFLNNHSGIVIDAGVFAAVYLIQKELRAYLNNKFLYDIWRNASKDGVGLAVEMLPGNINVFLVIKDDK
ncbi:MAG: hypothetical protein LBD57_04415 [Endomicrobium sp.]|jgi:hypothetical protein|uniref:hypothetical protein n=1 Tax=Candidatus Endomicrobiellum cubanum TaxID=3242325 RepID=UPI00281C8999|nr:hypothetical protein [Endomicrobium sp.]